METADPFAADVTDDAADPFGSQSLEEMADPSGFGESPESELAGEQGSPAAESDQPPVVDREGNRVDPTPQAESVGPTDEDMAAAALGTDELPPPAAPDPTPVSSAPSAEPAAAVAEPPAAPAEAAPAPSGEAAPVETAASQAQAAPAAPEAAPAGVDTPETAEALPAAPADPTPAGDGETTGSTSEPAKPKATRKRKGKAANAESTEGPRNYRALYQTGKRTWEEVPLAGTDFVADVKEHLAFEDGEWWIVANNVDQARRIAYGAAGRPRDGIRLVLIAEKSWQPRSVKPKVIPAREALDIS